MESSRKSSRKSTLEPINHSVYTDPVIESGSLRRMCAFPVSLQTEPHENTIELLSLMLLVGKVCVDWNNGRECSEDVDDIVRSVPQQLTKSQRRSQVL
jgi:hypothetical protein